MNEFVENIVWLSFGGFVLLLAYALASQLTKVPNLIIEDKIEELKIHNRKTSKTFYRGTSILIYLNISLVILVRYKNNDSSLSEIGILLVIHSILCLYVLVNVFRKFKMQKIEKKE